VAAANPSFYPGMWCWRLDQKIEPAFDIIDRVRWSSQDEVFWLQSRLTPRAIAQILGGRIAMQDAGAGSDAVIAMEQTGDADSRLATRARAQASTQVEHEIPKGVRRRWTIRQQVRATDPPLNDKNESDDEPRRRGPRQDRANSVREGHCTEISNAVDGALTCVKNDDIAAARDDFPGRIFSR